MASLGHPSVHNLPEVRLTSARKESEPNEIGGASSNDARERHLDADPYGLRQKVQSILNNNPIGLNPEGYYLPDDEYDTLFQPDAIQSALGGSHMTLPLVEYVRKKAEKTFATLLLVFTDCEARLKAMKALMANEFTDNELSSKLDLCPCRPRAQSCAHNFRYLNPWDLTALTNFKRERWQFLVPKFETEEFIYEFDNDRLLPFVERIPAGEIPSGHFSDVARVKMLASKQNMIDVPDKTITVALKTLRRINDLGYDIHTEWKREANAHKLLNGKREHIIQAFAAYQQKAAHQENNTYHLVLEWADGGSLHDFWDKNRAPQLDHLDVQKSRQRVLEMLEQLWGLADALEGMHSTSSQSPGRSRDVSAGSSPQRSPVRNERGRGDGLDAGGPCTDSSPLPKLIFNVVDEDGPTPAGKALPALSVSTPNPASLEVIGHPDLKRRTSSLNSVNCRHGDIKPENILRFTNGKADTGLGVLKLADLGRAQQHMEATMMRETKEKELWRTRWYEPPDLEEKNHKEANEKISRLFDIWSMGCVIFEAVLWLIYGYNSVGVFLNANKLTTGEQGATPYWRKAKSGKYEVSNTVTIWTENMLESDPERNGAIGHLVKLVRDRLLKIDLPPNSDVYVEGFRTNAKDLREQLEFIIEKARENEEYWFSGADRKNVSPPEQAEPSTNVSPQSSGGSSLSPNDAWRTIQAPVRGQRTAIFMQREYTNRLEDKWKTIDDNGFVQSNVAGRYSTSSVQDLCVDCQRIDILSPKIEFEMDKLKSNSDDEECDLVCDLCELVYTAVKDLHPTSHISMIRSDNNFILDGTDLKILRLCCEKSGKHQDLGVL
jgi:serine/threonine protein kinase